MTEHTFASPSPAVPLPGAPAVYFEVHAVVPIVGGTFLRRFHHEADARLWCEDRPPTRLLRVTVEDVSTVPASTGEQQR